MSVNEVKLLIVVMVSNVFKAILCLFSFPSFLLFKMVFFIKVKAICTILIYYLRTTTIALRREKIA